MSLIGTDETILNDRLSTLARWIKECHREIALKKMGLEGYADEVEEITAELARRAKETKCVSVES